MTLLLVLTANTTVAVRKKINNVNLKSSTNYTLLLCRTRYREIITVHELKSAVPATRKDPAEYDEQSLPAD